MTITFRSQTNTGFANAVAVPMLTLNKPAGVIDGDLLIAGIYGDLALSVTAPAGWTLLKKVTAKRSFKVGKVHVGDIWGTLAIFSKVASSEPGSWTWSFAGRKVKVGQGAVTAWISSGLRADVIQAHSSVGTGNGVKCIGGTSKSQNEQVLRFAVGDFFQGNDAPGSNAPHPKEKPQASPTSFSTLAGYSKRVNRTNAYLLSGGRRQAVFTVQDQFKQDPAIIPTVVMRLDKPAHVNLAITVSLPSGDSAPAAANEFPYDNWAMDIASGAITFAWQFADTDQQDVQQSYAFRRKIGVGAYEWWNAGTTTWQGSEIFNASSHNYLQFPPAKWANGATYLWSVAAKDNHGVPSSYSADTTVVGDGSLPTVAIVNPEFDFLGPGRLIVSWSLTGGAGDIGFVRIKVFDGGDSGQPFFDPNVSLPLWDSGLSRQASGTAFTTSTITQDLPQGTYEVFVLVADTTLQSPGWISKLFDISNHAGGAPQLTATAASGGRGPRNDLTAVNVMNLLTFDQSTFQNFGTGWQVVSNCSVARDTGNSFIGQASLGMTASANGTMQATTYQNKSGIPVVFGLSYKAYFRMAGANFGAARNCRVGIQWYDASGTAISTAFGTVVSVSNGSWSLLTITGTAPLGATWAAVIAEVQAALINEKAYVDQVFLGGSTADPTLFSVGGRFYGNLLDYDVGSFENFFDSETAWQNEDGNVTVTRENTGARSRYCSLKGKIQYGGDPGTPPIGSVAEILSPLTPIASGVVFTGSVWLKASAVRLFSVSLDWYDVLGNLISSLDGSSFSVSTTYVQVYATGVAPANTDSVQIRVTMHSPVLGDTFNMDDVVLTRGFTLMVDRGNSTPMLLEIEYSDDVGVTWQKAVRGANMVQVDLSDGINSVSDYEAPIAVPRQYRAHLTSPDRTTFTNLSPVTTSTPASTGDWWLKDPFDSSLNMKMFITGGSGEGIQFSGGATNAKFDVMGRPDWVVVTDTWKYDTISFKSMLFKSEYDAFEKIRKNNRPLLLQSEDGRQYYVVFDQRQALRVNSSQEFNDLTMGFIQVKVPS